MAEAPSGVGTAVTGGGGAHLERDSDGLSDSSLGDTQKSRESGHDRGDLRRNVQVVGGRRGLAHNPTLKPLYTLVKR